MPSYRFKCRNSRCGGEFHRHYAVSEFDRHQYGSGWSCFNCGFPRMAVIKSNRAVKDGFQPGYQRNIGKHCSTYSEYKAHLKNMGLIELGYEDLPMTGEDEKINYWTDDILKKVYDSGVEISGREAAALKSGELTKD